MSRALLERKCSKDFLYTAVAFGDGIKSGREMNDARRGEERGLGCSVGDDD